MVDPDLLKTNLAQLKRKLIRNPKELLRFEVSSREEALLIKTELTLKEKQRVTLFWSGPESPEEREL